MRVDGWICRDGDVGYRDKIGSEEGATGKRARKMMIAMIVEDKATFVSYFLARNP